MHVSRIGTLIALLHKHRSRGRLSDFTLDYGRIEAPRQCSS